MSKKHLAWWKFIVVWIGFLLLHFSYKTFPGMFFQILAEKNETTFLHMKMLFFSYLVVSLVELLVRWKTVPSKDTFIYSRLLIAVAYPWLTITLWFAAQALGIQVPIIPWELIYANVMTLLGIYLAMRLEQYFDETALVFRPAFKAIILLVFAAALLSYVSFSLIQPMPFFTTPPGE